MIINIKTQTTIEYKNLAIRSLHALVMEKSFSLNSNESKVEEDHRRKTRRRLIIIAVSSAILLALVAGAIILSTRAKSSSTKGQQSILESICNVTLYQESCYSSISSLNQSTKTAKQIFTLSLQVAFVRFLYKKESIMILHLPIVTRISNLLARGSLPIRQT